MASRATSANQPTPKPCSTTGERVASFLDRVRKIGATEMRQGGLTLPPGEGLAVNLAPLRLDPGASPARAILPHLEHRGRPTRLARFLERARSAPQPKQLTMYRAYAGACLIAVADRSGQEMDPDDRFLLGMCVDYWLHQIDVERTRGNFESHFKTHAARQPRKPHIAEHFNTARELKDANAMSNEKIIAHIVAACQKEHRDCTLEGVRSQLYRNPKQWRS